MFDGRMPFEVPHASDGDSQEVQSGVCDFVCLEVYGYNIINGGFVLSCACDQAGLWAANQTEVLELSTKKHQAQWSS